MTTPEPARAQRAPWYRSPWPVMIVGSAALAALLVGLGLRFFTDPHPAEAVSQLRQFALIFGLGASIVSSYATTTAPGRVASFGRGLVLRVFPRLDEQPPPVTAAASRWAPIAQRLALTAWFGAAIWFVVALIGWLIGRAG